MIALRTVVTKVLNAVCIIALLFIAHTASANDTILPVNDTARYSCNNSMLGLGRTKISFLSPITYSAFVYQQQRSNTQLFNNKQRYFQLDFSLGAYENINENVLISLGSNCMYSISYFVPISKNATIYAGGATSLFGEIYLKPDNMNNVLYTNLGNNYSLELTMSKKYKWIRFSNRLNLVLFGLYYGSSYSQNMPGVIEKEAGFWNGCTIGSFETNTQLHNNFYIDTRIKYKKTAYQTLRFGYGIEYQKLQRNNTLKHLLIHKISIGFLFKKLPFNH